MLTLSGRALRHIGQPKRTLLRLSSNPNLPVVLRSQYALLHKRGDGLQGGFGYYLLLDDDENTPPTHSSWGQFSSVFSYLADEDIIRINNGQIRTLFRKRSPHNNLFLTERCDNYCLMCSQPPRDVDDAWLLEQAMQLVRMIPRETKSLGITGGEPTLHGDGFVELISIAKSWLPDTAIHVLSNGRRFSDPDFAQSYAKVKHHNLMVGIPVYSDDPAQHDYVVQAKGAFDETIRGILNLKQRNQRVEIRVVLHKLTVERLNHLAQFIARNLLFVDQVALMGLEITGFTRANLDKLWIDPAEYKEQLSKAVKLLSGYGIRALVYNHPLCLVNRDIEPYYVRSISDWKNEYATECTPCVRKSECGGFFSSGLAHRYSPSIEPFL